MPSLLHVGCGRAPLPAWLEGFTEVRLDIDPRVEPDIVAPMTDLGDIGPFDGIYSSHCLEHLYPHEVSQALAEFRRVLKPGGQAIIFVPDLEGVAPTEDVLYMSASGPVCGLDMFFGKASFIAENPHMAHHCGFVRETLQGAVEAAGFARAEVVRTSFWNLMAVCFR